jgi:hypothetical protein
MKQIICDDKTGGFFTDLKDCEIVFTNKIKKLCLFNCENVLVHLKEKCYTRIEVIRSHNVILKFDREVYNLQIDLSTGISIQLNDYNKHLIYIYCMSCMDISAEYKFKSLFVKYSMFGEQYQTNYYKDEVHIERIR